MGKAVSHLTFGTPEQLAVLVNLEPFVREQTEAHLQTRKLWFPNELMPADEGAEDEPELRRLRDAARGLPDVARVAIALNLMTEEGLPHFHRLIATHLGNESPWSTWNNLWTAEEDRHGCAMRDYVRDARLFNMGALERAQYNYLESGFNPHWEQDPYRLLAYTSLQERATQVAHANTGRVCATWEPKIQNVLAHLSADERRHYHFYRAIFGEVLKRDPDNALQSLYKVMPALAMPGHLMPGYDHMAEVVRRYNIYGPRHYAKIVEELLDHWQIAAMGGLTAIGREMQDKLMKIPVRLKRISEYVESRAAERSFSFEFLYNRPITL